MSNRKSFSLINHQKQVQPMQLPSQDQKPKFSHYLRNKVRAAQGLGTVEIVIIIAVLLSVALLFREQITSFAQELMDKVFDSSIVDQLG
ncbi:MAG: Flp1 family type IVb pilin [Eubacteriales bacterium]|nr:Flp1 family type IVb pilin [Eubacteriales bacterium]